MVLKLYGFPRSPNVTRVAVVLHEKQVPFDLVSVDLSKKENLTAEFLEKQPFGEVPYIDDDGFILYESWAIARYICEKYRDQGPNLIPTDLKKRALFDQAAAIEGANFQPHARSIVWEGLVTKILKLESNPVKLEESKAALEKKLESYERILSKQEYLAGDEITLADLMHLGYGANLSLATCDGLVNSEKRPHLAKWFESVQSRPSWQAVKGGVMSWPGINQQVVHDKTTAEAGS